jgi:hypothetical protein
MAELRIVFPFPAFREDSKDPPLEQLRVYDAVDSRWVVELGLQTRPIFSFLKTHSIAPHLHPCLRKVGLDW